MLSSPPYDSQRNFKTNCVTVHCSEPAVLSFFTSCVLLITWLITSLCVCCWRCWFIWGFGLYEKFILLLKVSWEKTAPENVAHYKSLLNPLKVTCIEAPKTEILQQADITSSVSAVTAVAKSTSSFGVCLCDCVIFVKKQSTQQARVLFSVINFGWSTT